MAAALAGPLFLSFILLHLTAADQFNCPKLPPLIRPAQNVYELRPQDIKVVMALGDSVTAGQYCIDLFTFHDHCIHFS